MTDSERILALEDRVQLLEDALGLTYEQPLNLGLTRYEAMIVGMLLRTKVASYDRIQTALYADRNDVPEVDCVRVFISRARRKLKPLGVDINNTWGVGYWIPAEQKARLADA